MKENSLSKSFKKTPTPIGVIDQDEEKKRNFQLIGKMFGNMAQSINVSDVNTLKTIVPNKFTGGFKQPSILKNNKPSLQEKVKIQSSLKKIDVFTVYDEFGLINDSVGKRNSTSKGKPKYRQEDQYQQNNSRFQIKESNLIGDMKNNRREQFDQVMQNNYVNLHEYYDLAKQKDRQQTVIHVKSSLDNMSLQNVEAKLQAHRREMKAIENSYKAKKGIKQQDDEQDEGQSPNKYFTKTGQNDLYKKYGKSQSQIYEMIKKTQKDDQQEVVLDQMWDDRIQQNPKLAEYSKKYEQYLVQKDAKNIMYSTVRQNLFKWDKSTQPPIKSTSKIHTKNKSKSKQKQKSISKLNKSLEKFQNQTSQQKSEMHLKSIKQVLASKDDKFIAKYIFAQVDVDKRGLLSKEQLLDYITKSQHIIKSYGIDLKWIYTDLDNFETKRKGMLNKEELGIFLATFQRVFHPQIKLTNVSDLSSKLNPKQTDKKSSRDSPFDICFAKDLYRFRNLFDKLDLNEDKILKREEFIENILIDPDCSQIIDNIVIKIKIIQKSITYRQIISFVLDDYRNEKNEKLKKSKEYITFNRFCEYFQCPESINLKNLNKKKTSKSSQQSNQIDVFDLEEENLFILKDIFDTIPRVYQEFIVSGDFIQTALMDPQVLAFQEDMCRIQSIQTDLPIETVRLTLQRMIRECDQYIEWETAKAFFSRRGRPLDWNQQLIKQKKAIREEQRSKSINQVLKRQLILKNQLQVSAKVKAQYQQQHKRTAENNFTIPQPFKITDEIKAKQKTKVQQNGQDQFNQLAKTFKAKPVNKEILEPKPQLIQGKRAASSTKNLPQYKYQNYQNDRIQRVLKKAQQQHQLQEQKQKLKEMANVKANNIGVDLTKNLMQVMKENKKNSKQNGTDSKKPLTQIQKKIAQRLHPSEGFAQSKLKKIVEKTKNAQQLEKQRQQEKKQQQQKLQQQSKKHREKADNIKKEKQEEDKKIKQAAASKQETFKPKLNPKKPLTENQLKAIEQKKLRQAEKQEEMRKALEQQEKRRQAILQRQQKDPYLKIEQFQNTQDIINKIYQFNILDILIDNQQRRQFNKQHDFQNKDKRQRELYLKGMANKFKITMEREEKVMKTLKQRQKEEIQKEKIAPKQTSVISEKGKSNQMKKDLIFHGSKALQRYKKLMEGITPSEVPSQFDRYTEQNFDDNKKPNRLKQIEEDEI